jgi:hypothetical protein
MMSDIERSAALGDEFDQARRKYIGTDKKTLPGVTVAGPANVTVTEAGFGLTTQDWVIETVRVSDRDEGDRIVSSKDIAFVRFMDRTGSHRMVLPSEVLAILARQREALGTKNKKRAARETMRRRKARGEDLGAALRDPKVRKSARAARKANAAKKRARKAQKDGGQNGQG